MRRRSMTRTSTTQRPIIVTSAVALAIALAGCGDGAAGPRATPGPTPAASGTPTSTAAAPSSAPPTPSTALPPGSDEEWTGETAYAACVAFQREKTAADGYDPDASTWNPYSPEVAKQDGGKWIVELTGTVTSEDGTVYDGVYSCLVSGTPSDPDVSEYFSG